MTDILLINPNTTASITDLVLRNAKRFASKGTKLRAVTGAFGPRYIASRVGYAIAGHAAVDALANDSGRKDAVVLACFGDPGLAALKEIAKVPVVGMADASILQACAMGNRFSISCTTSHFAVFNCLCETTIEYQRKVSVQPPMASSHRYSIESFDVRYPMNPMMAQFRARK